MHVPNEITKNKKIVFKCSNLNCEASERENMNIDFLKENNKRRRNEMNSS